MKYIGFVIEFIVLIQFKVWWSEKMVLCNYVIGVVIGNNWLDCEFNKEELDKLRKWI